MSCCLYWVILEERLSVRVLASADDELSICHTLLIPTKMKFVRELLYGATTNSMTMDSVHLGRNDADEYALHIKRSFYSYRAKLRIRTCRNSFATIFVKTAYKIQRLCSAVHVFKYPVK